MTGVIVLGGVALDERAKYRNAIVLQYIAQLQDMAWCALNIHNKQNHEFVVASIQADDAPWRDISEHLAPGRDWQPFRDKGMTPMIHVIMGWAFCEIVSCRIPSIADVLKAKPAPEKAKLIALAVGGGTVYQIEPRAAPKRLN